MNTSDTGAYWPEHRTEEHERYLMLEGLVAVRPEPYPGLLVNPGPAGRLCMVGFAYADLPLPASFDIVLSRDDPKIWRDAPAVVLAVTQQYGKPFDLIPHGWRTLCTIDFPSGVPDLVDALPVVQSWDYSQATGRIALCRRAAFAAVSRHLAVNERGHG